MRVVALLRNSFRRTVAGFVRHVLFDKPELYRGTGIPVSVAQATFQIAAITPVDIFGVAAEDFKGWCRIVSFLDHIIELRIAVF